MSIGDNAYEVAKQRERKEPRREAQKQGNGTNGFYDYDKKADDPWQVLLHGHITHGAFKTIASKPSEKLLRTMGENNKGNCHAGN